MSHEMHQEEQLNFDVDSDIDDNTISYHQYQVDSEVKTIPTEVSSVSPGEIYMITILDDLRTQLDGHLKVNQEQSMVNDSLRVELARYKQEMLEKENVLLKSKLSQNVESINSLKTESKKVVFEKKDLEESNPWTLKQAKLSQTTLYDGHALLNTTHSPVRVHDSEDSLVHAEVSRTKMSKRLGTIKPINYAELNALYNHFVPQKELSREQVYWLPAEELATQKNICSIVLASDIVVPPSSNYLCEELRSNCDREHSKVIELEAEILKKQQMLNESEKRCAFIEKNHVNLQVKFQKYKECLQNQRVCDNSNSTSSNCKYLKLNKVKGSLQGKDDTIENLQTQINITRMLNVGSTVGSFDKQALETELTQLKDALTLVRIQIDGYKAENVNLKRRYEELSKSNAYSRSTFTAKINALTAENAKLKTELSGKKSSGSTPRETKVLA
ncbi:hypothetical protein Tco_0490213 [Tanacetum coccineum]